MRCSVTIALITSTQAWLFEFVRLKTHTQTHFSTETSGDHNLALADVMKCFSLFNVGNAARRDLWVTSDGESSPLSQRKGKERNFT